MSALSGGTHYYRQISHDYGGNMNKQNEKEYVVLYIEEIDFYNPIIEDNDKYELSYHRFFENVHDARKFVYDLDDKYTEIAIYKLNEVFLDEN